MSIREGVAGLLKLIEARARLFRRRAGSSPDAEFVHSTPRTSFCLRRGVRSAWIRSSASAPRRRDRLRRRVLSPATQGLPAVAARRARGLIISPDSRFVAACGGLNAGKLDDARDPFWSSQECSDQAVPQIFAWKRRALVGNRAARHRRRRSLARPARAACLVLTGIARCHVRLPSRPSFARRVDEARLPRRHSTACLPIRPSRAALRNLSRRRGMGAETYEEVISRACAPPSA